LIESSIRQRFVAGKHIGRKNYAVIACIERCDPTTLSHTEGGKVKRVMAKKKKAAKKAAKKRGSKGKRRGGKKFGDMGPRQ
jgi:hypothetical protein